MWAFLYAVYLVYMEAFLQRDDEYRSTVLRYSVFRYRYNSDTEPIFFGIAYRHRAYGIVVAVRLRHPSLNMTRDTWYQVPGTSFVLKNCFGLFVSNMKRADNTINGVEGRHNGGGWGL